MKEQKFRLKINLKDKLIIDPQIIKLRNLLCKNKKSGNTKNTMGFVKSLKEQRLGKRQAIFGDGTNYHNSQEFRELLKLINQEKPEKKWWINCLKFAPNAPEKTLQKIFGYKRKIL